jgi:hypothetical protein
MGDRLEIAVAALKFHNTPKHDADHAPEAKNADAAGPKKQAGWYSGDLTTRVTESPARRLQAELFTQLRKPHRISIRSTLATLAIACLSMAVAGLYLAASI